MNLKEAFRFQNRLQALMDEAGDILGDERNVTLVQHTYLRKKIMPEAENETVTDVPPSEYGEHITELAEFLLYLLEERERLSAAIRRAKQGLPIDMDSEVSLNGKRQEIARLLKRMGGIRSAEVLIKNGGVGYRFNAEGNQVSYCCDEKRVTTIHFDRKRIQRFSAELNRKADEVSRALDRCVINTAMEYQPPFDVNESFGDVFEGWLEARAAG